MIRTNIITPYGPVYEGLATGVNLPGTEGAFEVKFNHASLMSMLEIGKVIVREKSGKEETFSVNGGFVEVFDNRVTVLAESAENVRDIDLDRARQAREKAAAKIREDKEQKAAQEDVLKAELALKRAINRIKLYELKR
ncbi:MAG: ATP synthase F1 subunit epsilon [Candidatus Cyclonatronum sp.]|uniref:ATP synthase F1 subunit epsilon n=1 Tax=Cyclonatronum sp. TaxID=3024185 RepID=UPI0025BE4EF2|nr:ATP synthase F1 subunit epsilon [Cyclonatronum sp.]MCC5933703.1 ATP synthase F1 subunit epsilon [Balneolales bacterium]MCH8486865.1 ATP synthase F1 subunit epsilon [Cyclonatronum sp.]